MIRINNPRYKVKEKRRGKTKKNIEIQLKIMKERIKIIIIMKSH
jgi:hypothetical protein